MSKKNKISEKQKLKAFKAFEASEVKQMPIEERQKGAIFQCHVTRIIANAHNDGNYNGGKVFIQQGMEVFGFNADQMHDFIQGIGDLKRGMEDALAERVAQSVKEEGVKENTENKPESKE